ncbi:ATP-binding protein, partial [Nocardiopsis rhodophaea]
RYPGTPDSVPRARHFAYTHALTYGDGAKDVVEVTGELVANALHHSRSAQPGGRIDVTVTCWTDRVRVEVTDDGPTTPGAAPVLRGLDLGLDWDFDRPCGVGMAIVDALTGGCWEVAQSEGRTSVWAEVARCRH